MDIASPKDMAHACSRHLWRVKPKAFQAVATFRGAGRSAFEIIAITTRIPPAPFRAVIGQPTDYTSALGSPLLFTVSAQSRQHRVRPVAKLMSNLLDPKPGLFRNPGMLPQSQRDGGIMTPGSLSDIAQRCPDRRTSHRRETEEPSADGGKFQGACLRR